MLRIRRRDALLVLGAALALRLIFAGLTADSYDPDEFVILSLSKHFAHGAVPYRDFTFFHPPGILVLFGALQPVIDLWWPAARVLMLLLDSVTAVIVWRIGLLLYGRREALAAGLLYAISPIALLGGVRVGQDSIITVLGMAGLLCLLTLRRWPGAILAGICLGVATWFKYPAVLFVPVYLLAAPRRVLAVLGTALATAALAFAPFLPQLGPLVSDSVGWQVGHRAHAPVLQRLGSVLAFWLVLNPLAVIGLWRWRSYACGLLPIRGSAGARTERRTASTLPGPIWLPAGFVLGVLFFFSAQVYYHYFMPIIPFASLLAAPLVALVTVRVMRALVLVTVTIVALWIAALHIEPTRIGLSELELSTANTTANLLDRITDRDAAVLTDQFEYVYLAKRRPVMDYFWDMQGWVGERSLVRRLKGAQAIVATGNPTTSYPRGFVQYLNRQGYAKIRTNGMTVWLVSGDQGHVSSRPARRAPATAP